MTVALFRRGGDIFLDNNGAPLSGGQLFYYQAGSTSQGQTWQDAAGTILNAFPILLNSSGRLPAPVYFGTAYNYKELLTDVNGATIAPWPFDGLPAAAAAAQQQTGFERLYLPWTSLTAASSPVTLTQANAGNAYECDCSGGSITINLPAAAAVNMAGTGFFFKRTDGVVANSLLITPNGTDNIDGVNSALAVGAGYQGLYLVSDGAQWLNFCFFNAAAQKVLTRQPVITSGGALAINMALGWDIDLTLNGTVTALTVTNWPASGFLGKLTLNITNGGAFNITGWPGTTLWTGGTAPTLTSGSGKKDSIMLTSSDGGATFRGYLLAQNLS